MNALKNMFKEWTTFEVCWLLVFFAANLYLYFAWNDTLLGLISSLAGMLCVVLVAKGKISNYFFGIVQTSSYAYISYGYGLYGEVMLNALFYLPVQFIGLFLWSKHKVDKSAAGEEIAVLRLSKSGWAKTIVVSAVGIAAYAVGLNVIGGKAVGLDSATTVLSIVAQILMLRRFAEQWILWIAVNVLSIVMWAYVLATQGGNDYTVLVMWTAFLINSVYGYVNWVKLGNAQAERS